MLVDLADGAVRRLDLVARQIGTGQAAGRLAVTPDAVGHENNPFINFIDRAIRGPVSFSRFPSLEWENREVDKIR
ncbi:hypothetical protein GCM10022284_32570 [Streptomyces hundungensis]